MDDERKCPRCGAPVPPGDNRIFCGECGCNLNGYTPEYQSPYRTPAENVDKLSIFDYIVMLIIFQIPLVGLIFMFVWGFGGSVGPNRKNFARAYLIMFAIMFVISIILSVMFMGFIDAVSSQLIAEGFNF